MAEVEAIDRKLGLQAGELEATFDGTLVAALDFLVDERFQGLRQTQIFCRSVSQHLIQMAAHRVQLQLFQFLL